MAAIPSVNIEHADDDSDSDDNDLLTLLKNLQSENYRHLQFNKTRPNNSFKNKVSFDTINARYIDDDVDRGRSLSPSKMDSFDMYKSTSDIYRSGRTDYPTTPIITHKGATLTKLHRLFHDLYINKVPSRSPSMRRRTIIVYISGRRHTWVALDWTLRHFAEDGDTIIVVTATNLQRLMRERFDERSPTGHFSPVSPTRGISSMVTGTQSPSSFSMVTGTQSSGNVNTQQNSTSNNNPSMSAMTPKMKLRQRNSPEYISTLANNIMAYILEVLNPNIIVRASVEIAVGKTKNVLQEMYKLHEPNFIVTGNKVSFNIGAPLRSWRSARLTDRLVNYPLPVIIVPSLNMNKMEVNLQNEINNKPKNESDLSGLQDELYRKKDYFSNWSNNLPSSLNKKINEKTNKSYPNSLLANTVSEPNSDSASIRSDASMNSDQSSIQSDGSYDSYEEISKLFYDFKVDMKESNNKLKTNPFDENYFSNFLINITDKSVRLSQNIIDVDPDFLGRGALLARAVTGSLSFGTVPYKTKSLLVPVEPERPTPQSGPSYKEIKKSLNAKSNVPPSIKIDDATPSSSPISSAPPGNSSIKFANLENPSKNREKSKMKLQSKTTFSKTLSHDEDNTDEFKSRPNIVPTRSHPDLKPGHGDFDPGKLKEEKEHKKKKKRFWGKLFK